MALELVPRHDEPLSAIERLEVLCDPGSIDLVRTGVRSGALGGVAAVVLVYFLLTGPFGLGDVRTRGSQAGVPNDVEAHARAWLLERRAEIERAPGPYPVFLVTAPCTFASLFCRCQMRSIDLAYPQSLTTVFRLNGAALFLPSSFGKSDFTVVCVGM